MNKKMEIIAAVDRNWGIGYKNHLLFHSKKDMSCFRQHTMGNIVIMGRKTLESFPGGVPLSGRTNIVLARNGLAEQTKEISSGYISEDTGTRLIPVRSVEEAREMAEDLPGKIYIIGGGEIYQEFLPLVSTAYITQFNAEKKADTFFPDLAADPEWEQVSASEEFREEELSFRFYRYERFLPNKSRKM